MSETHLHIYLNGESGTVAPTVKKKGTASKRKAPATPPKRNSGRKDPKMAAAMKQAHKAAKKKDGSFRKGWDQSKMMKHAHKLKKK